MKICSFLSNINDDIQWRCRQHYQKKQEISGKTWIAPSCNLLESNAFKKRKTIDLSSIDVKTIAQQNGLNVPTQFKAASITNHCVSMSLSFIKKISDQQTIEQAAQDLQNGADEDCARCSIAYTALYEANKNSPEISEVLLNKLRKAAANIFDLSFENEINLNMPLIEMSDYLNNQLKCGKYLICLPGHLVTLIKNEKGLFLYDPNQGTMNLAKNDDQTFVHFLEKYKIQFSEHLTLIKVADKQRDFRQVKTYQAEEILSLKDQKQPPKLKFRPFSPSSNKWTFVDLTFRDKNYPFIKNQLNGLIYNGDPKNLIRFKCCVLILRSLIDTPIRIVYHIAMSMISALKLPFCVFLARKNAIECTNKLKSSLSDIFRAPLYGIAGVGAAFYGVFKPYEGRELYGYLERCLNRQNDHVNWHSKYYAAPCFVPLNFGAINRNDETETIAILKKFVIKIQNIHISYIFQAFCGWTKSVCAR